MDALIDLLFGNPFLLFLIIAGIVSFLQRLGNKGKQEETKKTAGRPAQGRAAEKKEIDWREIFRQEEAPPAKQEHRPAPAMSQAETSRGTNQVPYNMEDNAESELEKAKNQLHNRYEELKKKKELALKQANKLADSPIVRSEIADNRSGGILDFKNVSGDDIVKGIVWAEVLGKPKARTSR
ncbi:hypothetical protein SAMN05421736_102159 [Evansella caseinilytica]|uniref:Uncharacterized protein n=1 Tax=Evansella caseinilytica TaxID=1503961 RepID=A0A1H3KJI0_9BACI|nr:hypothetical protein [Evansella caseinilytica]SDY51818.1 hypothetical protein SAMN05421736_102159 [Evansella caseinilytica]